MVRSGCGVGAGICDYCVDGMYKNNSATNATSASTCMPCGACPAGHARTGCMGSSSGNCTACSPGLYLPQSAAANASAACMECPAGQTSAAGQPKCSEITLAPTSSPTPAPTSTPTPAPTPTSLSLPLQETFDDNAKLAMDDDEKDADGAKSEVSSGVLVGGMIGVFAVVVVLVRLTSARRRSAAHYKGSVGQGVRRGRAALQSILAGRRGAGVSTRIGAQRLQDDDEDDDAEEVNLGIEQPNPIAQAAQAAQARELEARTGALTVPDVDGPDPFADESL